MIADAIEHTKHTALGGEILFITHLMLLPYIRRGLDWHLIFGRDTASQFGAPGSICHGPII